jgi:superfamily II DNA or RNA helicase
MIKHIKGGTFGLEAELWRDDVVAVLAQLPGLRINHSKGRLEGGIDAIAAAQHRLGVQGPSTEMVQDGIIIGGEVTDPLRHYQKDGVSRVRNIMNTMGGALLADEMGLGKTVQAITVGKTLTGRKIVICPASVRETWRDDLKKWGVASYAILGPTNTKDAMKEWADAPSKEWIVVSYALATKAYELVFPDGPPTLTIIDEIQLVKGRKSKGKDVQRAGAAEYIASMSQYRLGLTGTPLWDRPRDLWRILHILFGSTFGSSWDFDHAYCGARPNEHGGLDNSGVSRADELRLRLSYYMVRREKSEVAKELPPLTRQTIWVDATRQATNALHSAILMKRPGDFYKAIEATLHGKAETAYELAQELRKFVLFTYRRSDAISMAKTLSEKYETPCVAVHGGMDTVRRQIEIKRAIANGWGVVATIDSVGTGVDVLKHVATTAIVHWIDFVPRKMAQMEARLHRLGVKGNVHIIYLAMKDSADTLTVKKVVEKLDAQIQVLRDSGGKGMRDTLGDHIDGAGAENAEREALKALYEDM